MELWGERNVRSAARSVLCELNQALASAQCHKQACAILSKAFGQTVTVAGHAHTHSLTHASTHCVSKMYRLTVGPLGGTEHTVGRRRAVNGRRYRAARGDSRRYVAFSDVWARSVALATPTVGQRQQTVSSATGEYVHKFAEDRGTSGSAVPSTPSLAGGSHAGRP